MTESDGIDPQGAREEAQFIKSMKRIREELGWSQGDLARAMKDAGWNGFHQTTISRIEKGERPVRLGEARGIATALGALVGQMILPGSGAKAVRDLELTWISVRKNAADLTAALHGYVLDQAILRENLRAVEEADLGDDPDEFVLDRVRRFTEQANYWIGRSYQDVINDYFEEDNGVDQETS